MSKTGNGMKTKYTEQEVKEEIRNLELAKSEASKRNDLITLRTMEQLLIRAKTKLDALKAEQKEEVMR